MPAHVTIQTVKLAALARRVSDPAAKVVLHKKIGAIYRSFAAERFNTFARGGGNWAPLALATVMSRRNNRPKKTKSRILDVKIVHARKTGKSRLEEVKAKKKPKKPKPIRSASILIDTGTLQAGLNPVLAPGAIEESRGNTVRLGFGGPARHPSGTATIADIASFHHFGTDYVPARPIIVAPDTKTLELMTRKVNEWLMTQ